MPHVPDGLDLRLRRRPTQLRINLDALTHNLRELRAIAPQAKVMAILKADAYGHGMLQVAHHLVDLGVDWFGVAFLEEGIALRQAGLEVPILVLGGLVGFQVKHFLDYHLDLTASSLFKAEQISQVAAQSRRTARVHLKIDTGMNRIGVRTAHAVDFVQQASRLPNLDIVGLFSHLHSAEDPTNDATTQQIADFAALNEELSRQNLRPPLAHLANSAAIFGLPRAHLDLVRPGIALYGCSPHPQGLLPSGVEVKAALAVHSQLVYIKGLRKGWGVGYGHTWHAPEDGWLATIPVGYGDGYPRLLSNRADVLLGGKRYPVVGQISMDQSTVWLGKDRYPIGEEVVLMGEQGQQCITAWELAHHAQTIAYEILCGWTLRVPRIYQRNGSDLREPAETDEQRFF